MRRTRPVRQLPRHGLGALIIEAREEHGMTLRALSRALGVSHAHVSDVETGRRLPSIEMLNALFDVLDVPERDQDLWYAAAEMLAPGMLRDLLECPDAWGEVRDVLARRAR